MSVLFTKKAVKSYHSLKVLPLQGGKIWVHRDKNNGFKGKP